MVRSCFGQIAKRQVSCVVTDQLLEKIIRNEKGHHAPTDTLFHFGDVCAFLHKGASTLCHIPRLLALPEITPSAQHIKDEIGLKIKLLRFGGLRAIVLCKHQILTQQLPRMIGKVLQGFVYVDDHNRRCFDHRSYIMQKWIANQFLNGCWRLIQPLAINFYFGMSCLT